MRISDWSSDVCSSDLFNALAGHPVVGASWEGFVIENLLAVAPEGAMARFYRTSAGAEVDLVLELPGGEVWAMEIKRGLTAKHRRGFHNAREELKPDRRTEERRVGKERIST